MRRRYRILLSLLVGVACTLSLTCICTIWLNVSPDTVIVELPQPPTPDYQSFGPYSVYVLEGPRDWSTLSWARRHRIVVARTGLTPPDYGHVIEYSFHPGVDPVDAHIRKSTAEWTADGVTFVEATGHRLFIPKAMFLGGR